MIKRKDIPQARVSNPNPVLREDRISAELAYDFALDRRNPFFRRVKAFLRGETKLGRKAGIILDVATIFLPGAARDGREAAQRILQRKNRPMPILKDKPWYKSKSIWSAVLIIVAAICQAIGLDPVIAYEFIFAIAGAFGLIGLRQAAAEKIAP